jgi:iron(III) transport system permease protein
MELRPPPGMGTRVHASVPRRVLAAVLPGLLALILAVFLIWPLAESLRGAFFDARETPTLAYVLNVFQTPIYREGFANALGVAVFSTLLAASLGTTAAVLIDRYTFPGRGILTLMVPLPLIVPPFVGAIGLRQLLGQSGAVNVLLVRLRWLDPAHPIDWLRQGRFATVVVLTALHLYPIVYFNVAAALGNLNIEMEEAARSLGCGALRAFRKITLPLIAPSVLGACSIVFIWGLTELGVPLVCDFTRITSVQIFSGLKEMGRNPTVHALVMVVLVGTVAIYAVSRLLFPPSSAARAQKGARLRRPRPLGPLASAAAVLGFGTLLSLAALPNVSVVLVAFARDWYGTILPSGFTLDHFRAALGHELVVSSIGNSLRYVALSTTFDLAVGTVAAFLLVRTRSRVTRALDAVIMLPLAIPGLVMAFGYLAITRLGGPLAFLNPIADPTALLVIAYTIRRLPFVVRSVAAGLAQIDLALEEAAASLGASRRRAVMRVTLPLLAPHLLAGGVFAFALSMLEVSDSLILAQRQSTFPVTKAIYELFQLIGDGPQLAAALGVWAMLFLASAIVFARTVLGKKLGAILRL